MCSPVFLVRNILLYTMRENSYKVISFPEMNFVPEPLQAYPAAVHRRFTGFTLLWQAPEGIFWAAAFCGVRVRVRIPSV